MAGTMSKADLVVDLKAVLMDAAKKFTATGDADFIRHVDVAALDMGRKRPRTLVGEITVEADRNNYPAPADLLQTKVPLWGNRERRNGNPWDRAWPGRLPRLMVAETATGRELWLDPAPTAAQIGLLGSAYKFFYFAGHRIGDAAADTTVQADDRALLLLRVTAQAMQELANNGVSKPVQLGDGFGIPPKNGAPAALAKDLMDLFERMAA